MQGQTILTGDQQTDPISSGQQTSRPAYRTGTHRRLFCILFYSQVVIFFKGVSEIEDLLRQIKVRQSQCFGIFPPRILNSILHLPVPKVFGSTFGFA